MQLKRIVLKGYKSIRELDLKLRPLNVLIGANGVGKSNFISVFKLLNEMVEGKFQSAVRSAGGAETFLHFGEKVTPEIRLELHFPPNAYTCSWRPTADDALYFDSETSSFHQVGRFKVPYEHELGSGQQESNLAGGSMNSPDDSYVLDALRSWRVYHFHDTSSSAGVKKRGAINDNIYFRPDASNLAAFLFKLQQTSPKNYTLIRNTVRQVAPFFDDFLLRPDQANDNNIRLEWREKGSDYPFLSHHLSDGTLRFICLATLLLQPDPPSTILIDEPELGLHPSAITMLAALLRSVSQKTQVIVSTQSVSLVNQLYLEDIIVVDREDNQSVFRHLNHSEMDNWLEDYGLGDLWEKNLLGGRP